jgi:hypothetical protein
LRLFDTELRLLTLEKCFQTVIADGTHTILFIPETELNIVDKLLASALNVRAKAQSQGKTSLKRIATDDTPHMVHELPPSPREEGATVINLPMHNQAVYDSRRSSWYSDESQYSPPPTPLTPSEAPKSPLWFSKAFIGPWTPLPHNARTAVLAKQPRDYELSFADASRLLRGKRPGVGKTSFTVLPPTDNGGFREREVDPCNEESMASALLYRVRSLLHDANQRKTP